MAVNSVKFSELKRVLGFESPYPGYNFFLGILGIGFGILIYGLVTLPAYTFSIGNNIFISYAVPFYLPLNAQPYSLILEKTLITSLLFYTAVGFFEESYKILLFKNISNYLFTKTGKENISLIFGFLGSVFLWGTYHYFSWNGLTILSIMFAVLYGFLFWLTYFIPDSIGILSPNIPVDWKNVMIIGAITCHITWDILVSNSIQIMSAQALVFLGFIMIAVSLFAMWAVRRYYVGFYSFERTVA